MSIINISKGNKALEFINARIRDEKYRGSRSSQHNCYEMTQIVTILSLLDQYTPNQSLMTIRTTDLSKRPENIPEEFIYAQFCNDAKERAGIGTQDAMRKNLFVDLHRMGFIVRYDKNKEETDPFEERNVKYVSISNQGQKLARANNILDRYFIFSKGIDQLLGGFIDTLLEILRNDDYGIKNINVYEYMFFVSAIGSGFSFSITTDMAVDFIKHYRDLTSIQRKSVVQFLRTELNPRRFSGKKMLKRDFHNWHNKVAQVYYLLNQTVYFETRGEQLFLKTGKGSFIENEKRLARSLNEKCQYFVNHKVPKISGFELHHVIPLAWSESQHHFKVLDKWENMLYMDAFNHAKITQNRNRNVVMSFVADDITLSDFSENIILLRYKKNVAYQPANRVIMEKYNTDLLTVIQ